MSKESKEFEQRIRRLHELIEGSGAEVTWDDSLPDPDNPSQPRQIDVTIRRDGFLTVGDGQEARDSEGEARFWEQLADRGLRASQNGGS